MKNVFSHAQGGRGITSFAVVSTRELEVLAIQKRKGWGWGGAKEFLPLKKGGWGRLHLRFFHFVAPLTGP